MTDVCLSVCLSVSVSVQFTVVDLHTNVSGLPHPNESNSFILAYIFIKKYPRRRLVPPPPPQPTRVGASQREILDSGLCPWYSIRIAYS